MESLDQVTLWVHNHVAVVSVVAGLLEVAMRLWPSNRVRSLLSYAGKFLVSLGNLVHALSDVVSKLVPDRRAPEKK